MRRFFFKSHAHAPLLVRMGFFGFSSGLTSSLLFTVLNGWLSSYDISLSTLGFFSICNWAYALKCLLSPFAERVGFFGITQRFGQRKGWVIISQILLSLCLAVLSFLNPQKNIDFLIIFSVCCFMGFWASFQDLVLEAYRVENTPPEAQSPVAASNAFGYRMGLWAMGYVPLVLAHYFGWQLSFLLLSFLSLLQILVVLSCPKEKPLPNEAERSYFPLLKESAKDLGHKFYLLWALGIMASHKLGDIFSRSMITPFLLKDQGYSIKDVANLDKGMGTLTVFLGVGLGALVIRRKNVRWALGIWAILQGIIGLLFALQANGTIECGIVCILFNHLSSGLGGAAMTVYLSFVASKNLHVAVAYALLTSFGSFVRIGVSMASGVVAQSYGWPIFFGISALFCLPTLLFCLCSKPFALRHSP